MTTNKKETPYPEKRNGFLFAAAEVEKHGSSAKSIQRYI
jgi:hypothetical protein